jgi:hypothetical protein
MQKELRALYAAIIKDDRAKVRELVKNHPELAKATISEPRLERALPHWIYAGDMMLHVAAAGYHVEIAETLLKAGADARSVGPFRNAQPLHYAADGCPGNPCWDAKRQLVMIRLLLKAGADIHAQDKNGATPLHRAVRTRCAEAVKFLLDAGADATIRNKPGSTPFHLAVQNTGRGGSGSQAAKDAQREIIEAFLKHDVSPKMKDTRGKTVLDWAKSDWIRELLTGQVG